MTTTSADQVLQCRPALVGLKCALGEYATATLQLLDARAQDINVYLDGDRVVGLKSFDLAASTQGDSGVLRVRPEHRIWEASGNEVMVEIVVTDRDDGHEIARIALRPVRIGEPIKVGDRLLDIPLLPPPAIPPLGAEADDA